MTAARLAHVQSMAVASVGVTPQPCCSAGHHRVAVPAWQRGIEPLRCACVPKQAAAGGALDAGELAAAEQAALKQELELLRVKLDAHPDVRRYAGAPA